MRRHSALGMIAGLAAAGLGVGSSLLAVEPLPPRPSTGYGVPSWRNRNTGSIALANRHTGQPHEHKREIARNLRRGIS